MILLASKFVLVFVLPVSIALGQTYPHIKSTFMIDQCGGYPPISPCVISRPWSLCTQLGGVQYGGDDQFCLFQSEHVVRIFQRSGGSPCPTNNGGYTYANSGWCVVVDPKQWLPVSQIRQISTIDQCGGHTSCQLSSPFSVCSVFNGVPSGQYDRYMRSTF
jgi:hypothetical protein